MQRGYCTTTKQEWPDSGSTLENIFCKFYEIKFLASFFCIATILVLMVYSHIASNPTEWAIFRPENVKEKRQRRKTMAEKGKDTKEEETLKHEKPPPFRWGCSMAILTIKLGIF